MPPRRPSCASSAPARSRHAARTRAESDPRRSARASRGRHLHVVRRHRDPGVPVPSPRRLGRRARAGGRVPARRPDELLRRRVGRARAVLHREGLRLAGDQLPRLDRLRPRVRAAQPRRLGRGGHEGLPRRRGLPPHARLGRRRPARHLRRELRLVHGAARGHGRSRSIASAAPCRSTATATSSPRGRRATARVSRTWGG